MFGEVFAEEARKLPPLGVHAASAYFERQALQSPEGVDLRLELHDGSRRGRPIENCLLGGQNLVLRRLVEVLDVLEVELRVKLGTWGGEFEPRPRPPRRSTSSSRNRLSSRSRRRRSDRWMASGEDASRRLQDRQREADGTGTLVVLQRLGTCLNSSRT